MKTKAILSVLISLFSASTFAAEASTVYCKIDNQVIDVRSEKGWECIGDLMHPSEDAVCFTGERAKVITLLNSSKIEALFDGTDGETIRDAHFKGKASIAYTYVDEVNAYEEKVSLERCRGSFFAE